MCSDEREIINSAFDFQERLAYIYSATPKISRSTHKTFQVRFERHGARVQLGKAIHKLMKISRKSAQDKKRTHFIIQMLQRTELRPSFLQTRILPSGFHKRLTLFP